MDALNGVRGAVSGMAPWRRSGLRALLMTLATDRIVRLSRPKVSW